MSAAFELCCDGSAWNNEGFAGVSVATADVVRVYAKSMLESVSSHCCWSSIWRFLDTYSIGFHQKWEQERKVSWNSPCTPIQVSPVVWGGPSPLILSCAPHSQRMLHWWRVTGREPFPCIHQSRVRGWTGLK